MLYLTQAHARLNASYLRELAPAEEAAEAPLTLTDLAEIRLIEEEWLASELMRISDRDLPSNGGEFSRWYRALYRKHRRDVEDFFHYMGRKANVEALAFYICLEGQVDGKFDDVIALAQIGLAGDEKLALAENYWDEMGLGRLAAIHTRMFNESADFMAEELALKGLAVADFVRDDALKNGNLLMFLALRREHALKLLGALTILEHTAPWRFKQTVRGLDRLGLPENVIAYHRQHISIDAKHGDDLLKRVILPLIRRRPSAVREIAVGCLLRLNIALDYYNSVREMLIEADIAMPPPIRGRGRSHMLS